MITRMPSISIVLEIAMPYAPASALEDWNTRTSVIVPTNSSQFTVGTYTWPISSSEECSTRSRGR